jgi:hypothetical protein
MNFLRAIKAAQGKIRSSLKAPPEAGRSAADDNLLGDPVELAMQEIQSEKIGVQSALQMAVRAASGGCERNAKPRSAVGSFIRDFFIVGGFVAAAGIASICLMAWTSGPLPAPASPLEPEGGDVVPSSPPSPAMSGDSYWKMDRSTASERKPTQETHVSVEAQAEREQPILIDETPSATDELKPVPQRPAGGITSIWDGQSLPSQREASSPPHSKSRTKHYSGAPKESASEKAYEAATGKEVVHKKDGSTYERRRPKKK